MEKKIITRTDLRDKIFERTDKAIAKYKIQKILTKFIDAVVDKLKDNEEVSIGKFGTFSSVLLHGHKHYNVNTGKISETNTRLTIVFHPSLNLKKKLDNCKDKFKIDSDSI